MRSKPGAPSERGLVSGGAGRAQARLAWRHLAVEAGRLPTLLPAVGPDGAVRGRPGAGGPRGPAAAAAARGDHAAAGKRRRGPGRAAAPAADGTGPRPALHDHARPDGRGRTGELTATLAGWTGAVGPSVPVDRAGTSLQWARRMLELVPAAPPPGRADRASAGSKVSGGPRGLKGLRQAGRPARQDAHRAEVHVPVLLLREGGSLTAIVAARRPAPLEQAGPRQGLRSAVTPLECMKHDFNATGAAEVLRVRPQTVRHRPAQLHDMFGSGIEDPAIRLEMMLLLHTWVERHGR